MKTEAVKPFEFAPRPAGSGQDQRPGFKEALLETVKDVNQLQVQAHQAMEELATGKTTSLHETMIAIEKAEIAFKMMTQVRNKIMAAYQEIMRLQT